MAEGADAEIRGRTAQTGEEIQVGPHGSEAADRCDSCAATALRIYWVCPAYRTLSASTMFSLRESNCFRSRPSATARSKSLFHEQVIDIKLPVPAEFVRTDDHIGIVELAVRNALEVFAGGTDVAVSRIVHAVEHSSTSARVTVLVTSWKLTRMVRPCNGACGQHAAFQQPLIRTERAEDIFLCAPRPRGLW